MMKTLLISLLLQALPLPRMVDIPAGTFWMGTENPPMEDWDEAPRREVKVDAFRMSATEITNAQYEAFDPKHQRGEQGFSKGDDEAVIMVSWDDAMAYCRWLSDKTGKHYRLPTEAEWEYACRAGTTTAYNTGDTFPESQWKVQRNTRDKEPVSLQVAQFEPNAWGLYDMHGNVEEWCYDEIDWQYRAVRGGSHNTPVRYLRSANRSASIPGDRSVLLGFRIVESNLQPRDEDWPLFSYGRARGHWGPAIGEPVFLEPLPYVIEPVNRHPFYAHNHQPAVTWTPGGELLAIWFSTDAEAGREMVVLQSSFKDGKWTPATPFCKVPDRNMTGSALLTLSKGEILHFQGVGDAGEWKDLALAMRRRRSGNKYGPWSCLRYIEPEHRVRHQVIAGPIVTKDGRILLCCDAGPDGEAGTSLHVSKDGGKTWEDTGSTIAGIHAGIVERKDGSLMAFGRGNAIDGHMPCSISYDGGYSWSYSPTEFPPIGSGQRLVLKRLQEGPLMLCSFGENGLFVALSYDEGATWPVKKLLTDGKTRTLDGGAWTGTFTMDATHAEPKDYLACTQSPDGMIHLLSSRVHYRFNLKWIEK